MDNLLSLRSLSWGGFVWLVPFIAAFPLFPLKEKSPVIFKTLMSVVLVLATVIASRRFFSADSSFADSALWIGCLWGAISIMIDLPLLVLAFKMKPRAYLLEIALGYSVIPAITWAIASPR